MTLKVTDNKYGRLS